MKRLLLFVLFSVSAILFVGLNVACNIIHGSGKLITEKRELSGFTAVDAGGAIEVEITQSDTYSVVVEADDNIMPKILTTVEDGALHISMKQKDLDFMNNTTVHVKISMPKISAIELSGASHGIAKNIKTEKLNIEVSGASKLITSGTTAELNSEVSGASKLDAKDLLAENASVECAGASKALVHANASLKAEASGASQVVYSGSPSVSEESSGASSISKE